MATHQALMDRRSLAWIEWTHVNKNKILGKFPKRETSAIEILAKGDASLQQRTKQEAMTRHARVFKPSQHKSRW